MTTIFVGGAQRTGTTVLQSLLCQSPGTNPMIMEADYLLGLVLTYAGAKRAWEIRTKDYFDNLEHLRRFHSEFIVTFLKNVASRYDDARHIVLKQPRLTLHFPELLELLPEAKFVIILRDPRDAIASMVEVGEKLCAEGTKKIFQERDMAELSNHFNSYYRPILHGKNAKLVEHTYLIRYEDLAAEPVAQIPGLREFTGLDIDLQISDQSLADSVSNRMLRTKQTAWRTDNYSLPLNSSSIGRHRTVLSSNEVREIEEHCRNILTAYGYI